jgi:hypothetical protein
MPIHEFPNGLLADGFHFPFDLRPTRRSPERPGLHLGKDEEAVAWLRRSIETNRNFSPAYLNLAAGLAHLGRSQEARAAVQAGLDIEPSFTIARCRASAPSDNALFLAQFERVLDGMRTAGVPEG